jgi:hypothetical protein
MKLNSNQKIYLGDRSIEKIIFETMKNKITIVFDCLSIFEKENWNPGESIDIDNCSVDFLDVKNYDIFPKGMMPNDYIVSIEISESNLRLKTLGELYNLENLDYETVEGYISIEYGDYFIHV